MPGGALTVRQATSALAAVSRTPAATELLKQLKRKASSEAGKYVLKKIKNKVADMVKKRGKAPSGPEESSNAKTGYKGTVKGKTVKTKGSRNKGVKVSKTFRKKVTKALEPSKNVGKYTSYLHGMLPIIDGALTRYNQQKLITEMTDGLLASLSVTYGDPYFTFFSPLRIRDVASSMWNGKTPSNNWAGASASNFAVEGLKIVVRYQSVKVTCRNNSGQTKEIDWYQCTPKGNTNIYAYTAWTNALAEETTDGRMNEVLTSTYGAGPFLSKSFGKAWKYTKHSMLLAPGQTASMYIKGPAATYDYEFFHDDADQTTEVDFVKGLTVSMFGILRNPDLTRSVSSAPVNEIQNGHLQGTALAWDGGIVTEICHKYVIECPEQTAVALQRDKQIYLHTPTQWNAAAANPTVVARATLKDDRLNYSNSIPM